MITHRPTLHAATRQHFGLTFNPFAEPTHIDEVFIGRGSREVLDAMRQTALRSGRFLAVVGESGAGKSTLVDSLLDRLSRTDPHVRTIRPGIEDSDDSIKRGKPVTMAHIREFIMATLAPAAPMRISTAARQMQLQQTLIDSARAGNRHLLLLEEGHDLTRTLLKQLKRLLEIKDGLSRVISVLLIAQPELLHKLNPNDPMMREVVQRCEIVRVPPLDTDLAPYLTHRFASGGGDLAKVIDTSGLDAIRARLTGNTRRGVAGSLLYPLAVENILATAMNAAAELGAPIVTRDIVGSAP